MNSTFITGILVGILILTSAVVTALLCFYLARHKKRIAYTTTVAFPFIATCSVMFCAALCIDGLSVFTHDYWMGYRVGPEIVFTIYGLIFALCFLPAFGVAVYYRGGAREMKKTCPKKLDRGDGGIPPQFHASRSWPAPPHHGR